MAHFQPEEFACPCCGLANIDPALLERLEVLRADYGQPIIVTSGFRCKSHNAKVGGRSNSQHLLGKAADITGPDVDKLYDLAINHFYSVGDGRNRNFIHVDLRPEVRRWDY